MPTWAEQLIVTGVRLFDFEQDELF